MENKKPSKSNNEADIKNANKGTDGTNKTYDKAQGNKGKQEQTQGTKNNAQTGKK